MTDNKQLKTTANAYIEGILLPSDPKEPLWNRESRLFGKPAKWNYIDNCMITAAIMLYEQSGDERLLDYAVRFMAEYVTPAGEIPTLIQADCNLDNFNGARQLMRLYNKTGDTRFQNAYNKLAALIKVQPRLDCGNFYHKAMYPRQVWLDGVYMALTFSAQLGMDSDVCRQLRNIRDIMRDKETGLYYHGYDETHTQSWADPDTGLSHEFWLRSIGWLCAGLADIYETAGSDTEMKRLSGEMLSDLLHSLADFAADDGTLMQLPARKELEGNYTETSGTLLFAYSALKASRLGAAGSDIAKAGERALMSVTEKYIEMRGGVPVLRNICLMAGLGGSPYRDGSAGYYLSERVVENDAKGVAPFLMAFAEYCRISQD